MSTSMDQLTGANLIAGVPSRRGDQRYRSIDPRTGQEIGPEFHDATQEEIAAAVEASEAAFRTSRGLRLDVVADLLRAVADGLEGLGAALIDAADAETALGPQRLTSERARTCGQLRAFADVVLDGGYLDVRIDHADPSLQPPKPDLRRMQVPLGPVAVFGASNFPLAFSVPGGDTASALAAACPVVAKAHPSHPATSEQCAQVIADAVAATGLPAGMFSLVHGRGIEVGQALVQAPQIKAVGFTGSHAAGRALFDLGAARPEPVPVYAEMGSLNPVFVTEAALTARGPAIASGFMQSMTMGTGQFCTKPGLVFLPDTEASQRFEAQIAREVSEHRGGILLNAQIREGLLAQLDETTRLDEVEVVARGPSVEGTGFVCAPIVVATTSDAFRRTPQLTQEHFGPVSVLVRCSSAEDMVAVADQLGGSLTATLHAEASDATALADLRDALREKCGRMIFNQFPTGVVVTHAMHHGGPYPSTTEPAHTSVGSAAIRRFLRPVTYQNMPSELLPPALQDGNPWSLPRMVDGRLESP